MRLGPRVTPHAHSFRDTRARVCVSLTGVRRDSVDGRAQVAASRDASKAEMELEKVKAVAAMELEQAVKDARSPPAPAAAPAPAPPTSDVLGDNASEQ